MTYMTSKEFIEMIEAKAMAELAWQNFVENEHEWLKPYYEEMENQCAADFR